MQPMVNLALRAARNAGQDLASRLERFDLHQSSDQEKAKFIADCTIGLEKNIIFDLKKSLPDHNYNGRETGLHGEDKKQPTWHIAVIDDVSNFRVGIPYFAILIACQSNNKTEHALVINPLTNDEFSASRGRGAQLNGRRIRCASVQQLSEATLGYTQPLGSSDNTTQQRERLANLLLQGQELRNFGSNALTLCYVAANRLQGAILSQMDDVSLLSAGLIATESGCLLSTLDGQALIKAPANLVAANPRLLKNLIKAAQ